LYLGHEDRWDHDEQIVPEAKGLVIGKALKCRFVEEDLWAHSASGDELRIKQCRRITPPMEGGPGNFPQEARRFGSGA
jgi:hypothetical protein